MLLMTEVEEAIMPEMSPVALKGTQFRPPSNCKKPVLLLRMMEPIGIQNVTPLMIALSGFGIVVKDGDTERIGAANAPARAGPGQISSSGSVV